MEKNSNHKAFYIPDEDEVDPQPVPKSNTSDLIPNKSENTKPKEEKTFFIHDSDDEEDVAPNIDCMFLLDITGSMQPYIDLARDHIKSIINQVKQKYMNSIIRIAVVGYRDVEDKPRYESFPFDTDVEKVKKFLKKIKAAGGDDKPEDMNGGLQVALGPNFDWTSPVKLIYHISDAPCHGQKFHTFHDNHPDGCKEDKPWETLLETLKTRNVNFIHFSVNNLTETMFSEFEKINKGLKSKSGFNPIFKKEILYWNINEEDEDGVIMESAVITGPNSTADYSDETNDESAKKFIDSTVKNMIDCINANKKQGKKKKLAV